ncbi:MAG: HAD-IB family hydrolase, partial [Pseudomonadota bacterium]
THASLRLALFDLDNTLLTGDTDVLWAEFLIDRHYIDQHVFAAANADMERRYKAGLVTAEEFCGFYASTLKGRLRVECEALRHEFFLASIRPCIPDAARALVAKHRVKGEALILTTATNRFLTELTAQDLGIEHLLATELEQIDGVFTGRTAGVLNMRDGKITRLLQWLNDRGWPASMLQDATFYSDSINDLPLLDAVAIPIVVDPDRKLAAQASVRGWKILRLPR